MLAKTLGIFFGLGAGVRFGLLGMLLFAYAGYRLGQVLGAAIKNLRVAKIYSYRQQETQPPSPWAVLGVAQDATKQEIKAAYRRKMAQYHPDKFNAKGASTQEIDAACARSAQISKAYKKLMQRQTRRD